MAINKDTCRHFKKLIPDEEADELRVFDVEPCAVCDVKPRNIYVDNILYHIPSFDFKVKDSICQKASVR